RLAYRRGLLSTPAIPPTLPRRRVPAGLDFLPSLLPQTTAGRLLIHRSERNLPGGGSRKRPFSHRRRGRSPKPRPLPVHWRPGDARGRLPDSLSSGTKANPAERGRLATLRDFSFSGLASWIPGGTFAPGTQR